MATYLGVDVVNEGKYYFISYNTEDQEVVAKYVKMMGEKRLPIWYDYGIEVGKKWEKAIAEHIKNSEAVIMFLSKNIFSKSESFVHKEYEMATRYFRKELYIVMLDEVKAEEVPTDYVFWWIDVNSLQGIPAYQCSSVESCVDKIMSAVGFEPEPLFIPLEVEKPREEKPKLAFQKGGGLPLGLLNSQFSGAGEAESLACKIEEVLSAYNLAITVSEIKNGPTYYRFYLDLPPKTQLRKVLSLKDDISLAVSRSEVVVSYQTNPAAVYVEIPKLHRNVVDLRDVLQSRRYVRGKKEQLLFAVGEDIEGKPVVLDLCKLPHLLIGGATGMGKSVMLHNMILSLIMKHSPKDLNLLLIDPKCVEFSVYSDLPHLVEGKVITDVNEALKAVESLNCEVERRFALFENANVRNIDEYNAKCGKMLYLAKTVVVIDEFSDFSFSDSRAFENTLCRLVQRSRAAGIFVVLATQRPSASVISGILKANIPSRIAFRVASYTDSRVLLDHGGAEGLVNHGDLLYFTAGMTAPLRCQGAYVSDSEVRSIVEYVSENAAEYYAE